MLQAALQAYLATPEAPITAVLYLSIMLAVADDAIVPNLKHMPLLTTLVFYAAADCYMH